MKTFECPLCNGASIAERQRLFRGGYVFQCPTCGGPFEAGTSAQAHADNGGIHPQAIDQMLQHLAEGRRPRVEFVVATPNSYYSVLLSRPAQPQSWTDARLAAGFSSQTIRVPMSNSVRFDTAEAVLLFELQAMFPCK